MGATEHGVQALLAGHPVGAVHGHVAQVAGHSAAPAGGAGAGVGEQGPHGRRCQLGRLLAHGPQPQVVLHGERLAVVGGPLAVVVEPLDHVEQPGLGQVGSGDGLPQHELGLGGLPPQGEGGRWLLLHLGHLGVLVDGGPGRPHHHGQQVEVERHGEGPEVERVAVQGGARRRLGPHRRLGQEGVERDRVALGHEHPVEADGLGAAGRHAQDLLVVPILEQGVAGAGHEQGPGATGALPGDGGPGDQVARVGGAAGVAELAVQPVAALHRLARALEAVADGGDEVAPWTEDLVLDLGRPVGGEQPQVGRTEGEAPAGTGVAPGDLQHHPVERVEPQLQAAVAGRAQDGEEPGLAHGPVDPGRVPAGPVGLVLLGPQLGLQGPGCGDQLGGGGRGRCGGHGGDRNPVPGPGSRPRSGPVLGAGGGRGLRFRPQASTEGDQR